MKKTLLLFLLVLAVGSFAIAQSRVSNLELDKDPRGKPELVICNQNLQNFGSFANFKARTRKDRDEYRQKTKALAQRFAKADCDLIAYQELIGLNDEEAEKGGKEHGHHWIIGERSDEQELDAIFSTNAMDEHMTASKKGCKLPGTLD